MAAIDVGGGLVEYEFVGDEGAPVIVVTPGGRFSKDEPGVQAFGRALAAQGLRVLLWDRPNTGRSQVQLHSATESHMRAGALHGLLTGLDVAPCVIAGGSGGARDSMLTVMLYPEVATKLAVWSIVGGVYGTVALSHNVLPSITAINQKGMDGLLASQPWKTLIETTPANRDRITALGEDGFRDVMLRWLNAFVPKPGQTIPGVEDELFRNIKVPTLIIRSGTADLNHPKRTSLEVSCLISGAQLIEPPWPENAWEAESRLRAQGKAHIFDYWTLGAPAIANFAKAS